jgi:inorganic pyrophosphatase/exopolyphosphatase
MADLDSIAGAIGAAYLHKGTAARASDVNSETKWALEKWGCEVPAKIEDLLKEQPSANVCLVDFQQQSQLHPAIPMSNIVGIIDHHALQSSTIITEKPIYVDIRPWGCMSSILAHTFAVQEHYLPKNIAGMLLSAILSDTLNLRSPTTTKWDERMVSMLVQYLEIEDVNELAAAQFRAKSHELSMMSPYQLVVGDMKEFKFEDSKGATHKVGYGVIETTDAQSSLDRVHDLIPEMREVKQEKDLMALLLAVVDIVNMTSSLLVCGPVEESLATTAYGGSVQNQFLELKGLVSRKKDFIPPLTKAFAGGWKPCSFEKGKRRTSHLVMDWHLGPGRLERIFDEEEEEPIEAAA